MEGFVSEGFVGLFVVSQEGHWSWKENITKKSAEILWLETRSPQRAEQPISYTCATPDQGKIELLKRLLYGPDINTKSEATL